jgi:RimJ/RimL family protein N-acetyltransferase
MSHYQISQLQNIHIQGYHQAFNKIVDEKCFLLSSQHKSEQLIAQFVRANLPAEGKPKRNVMLVAQSSNRVFGWCDIIRKNEASQYHVGVLSVALLKQFRGQGIGKEILIQSLKQAKELGIWRIELEVFADNKPAIALYKQLGFVEEGIKKRARLFNGRFQNILLMALISD